MSSPTVKENKLVWSFTFDTFTRELERTFRDGWTLVPNSLVATVLPPCNSYETRERYMAVVEK